ncbi:dTDP-4-dehydrorhamnose reductase [Hyphomicrobium sp.]|uniref:dTDP-4-dehydrorhamnose reductase n=1 Tax=Hyphomicrobium sp. TaxID=82 RepID=UPI000FB4BE6C|nr:dTDP-4-dehydrorhamnose reductase [Hyphomicrobium sp.]RUO97852.1 MAG: dTDP-4-dehydrorhamnose reductase [Hyphomicrobium sp.]
MTAERGTILIIGRNGQLARALHDVFTASAQQFIALGRPEIDLSDPPTAKTAIIAARPAVVINAAAYTAVDRAEDDAEAAFAINEAGAKAAAEAAAEIGASIVHVSTDYVFDGKKDSPYVESDPTAPLGVYGSSKRAGELAVAAANPKHLILRTSWVFSPYGANFVKTMLRLNSERSELNVVDDQFGNPTSALDLARAIARMLPKLLDSSPDSQAFGIFHVVNAGTTTWRGFAEAIIGAAHRRGAPRANVRAIGTKDYPTRASRPGYSALATDKITGVFGIHLRPWPNALSECLDQLIGPTREDMIQPQEAFGRST